MTTRALQTDIVSHVQQLTTGTSMHYLVAGTGEPVVLLHGFPQTSSCWRTTIPHLREKYTVIAPDLRGLGQTTAPSNATYDKKTLAKEVAELLVNHLGFERFHAVGHDWGGVVAFSLAAHYREHVSSLSIVDVPIPSDLNPDMGQGGNRWHHGFHNTLGLPETLVTGREAIYLNWFFDNYGLTPDAIPDTHRESYIRAYENPASLRASFEYYRATAQDRANITHAVADHPLEMPILAVGGSGAWGRGHEVRDSLIPVVRGEVTEFVLEGAGHWVPEEQPAELAQALLEHFSRA